MYNEQRLLRWDACYNARDVGGYATHDGGHIRWRALIRADNLSRLSVSGRSALVAHGIRTIIDLRSPFELEIEPTPFAVPAHADAPTYINVPLMDNLAANADEAPREMADVYRLIVDGARQEIGTIMTAVARAPSGGVLVHCHSGKDRTGLVIALLLDLAGVPRDIIAGDYALSNQCLRPVLEEQLSRAASPGARERITQALTSPPERILATLRHIDASYGGVESYFLRCGVTPEDMELIRERLVSRE